MFKGDYDPEILVNLSLGINYEDPSIESKNITSKAEFKNLENNESFNINGRLIEVNIDETSSLFRLKVYFSCLGQTLYVSTFNKENLSPLIDKHYDLKNFENDYNGKMLLIKALVVKKIQGKTERTYYNILHLKNI